jgi:hypothetical protein
VRFQIAVDDAAMVGGGHRLGHLQDQGGCLPLRRWSRLQTRLKRRPVHEGHRQVVVPVVPSDLEDRDNAGMVERGERNLSILNLRRLAKVLRVPIAELFPGPY